MGSLVSWLALSAAYPNCRTAHCLAVRCDTLELWVHCIHVDSNDTFSSCVKTQIISSMLCWQGTARMPDPVAPPLVLSARYPSAQHSLLTVGCTGQDRARTPLEWPTVDSYFTVTTVLYCTVVGCAGATVAPFALETCITRKPRDNWCTSPLISGGSYQLAPASLISQPASTIPNWQFHESWLGFGPCAESVSSQ